MPRYSCDLSGRCFTTLGNGQYATLEECGADCQGLTSQLDKELVRQMSSEEKKRINVNGVKASSIIYYLALEEYEKILQDSTRLPYPLLIEYVDR